jgi:hypothetical protein
VGLHSVDNTTACKASEQDNSNKNLSLAGSDFTTRLEAANSRYIISHLKDPSLSKENNTHDEKTNEYQSDQLQKSELQSAPKAV